MSDIVVKVLLEKKTLLEKKKSSRLKTLEGSSDFFDYQYPHNYEKRFANMSISWCTVATNGGDYIVKGVLLYAEQKTGKMSITL